MTETTRRFPISGRYGLLIVAALYGMWQLRSYEIHRYQHMDFHKVLSVSDANVVVDDSVAPPRAVWLGTIRNSSNRPWEDVVVELAFLDQSDRLVDVVNPESGMFVPRDSNVSFRFEGRLTKALVANSRSQVRIRSAR